VISPCLLNVALHGLEEAAGVRYRACGTQAGKLIPGSPAAVRYADDVIVLCGSQQQAEQVKAQLAKWLAPRGLAFNEDKTKIVHLGEGFDFLGYADAPAMPMRWLRSRSALLRSGSCSAYLLRVLAS
jgi:RNA-directed DNA polymerase